MSLRLLAIAALLSPALALAAEPSGCDKFKWPLAREQAALAAADAKSPESGAAFALDAASHLSLAPFAEAKLDMPPERAPKVSPSYAGAVKVAAPATAGTFKVSISDEGWIDVIQDGRLLKPVAFSGATDCPALRKSVKFSLSAAPLTIQVSNVKTPAISLMISGE
jgi:hypothetical protein